MSAHHTLYELDQIYTSLQSISDLLKIDEFDPVLLQPYVDLVLEKSHHCFTEAASNLQLFQIQQKTLECKSEDERKQFLEDWKNREEKVYAFQSI